MTKSVDDLIASIPEAQAGAQCWASRLDGRAAEFVAGVKAREQAGVKLRRGTIRDILKREFGITIGDEALRKHLLERCRCDEA